jgi:hypothetical protein
MRGYEVRHHELERPIAEGRHRRAAADKQEGGDEQHLWAVRAAQQQHAIEPAMQGPDRCIRLCNATAQTLYQVDFAKLEESAPSFQRTFGLGVNARRNWAARSI